MDQDSSFVVTPRTVLGVAIVLLGFALTLDRLGIAEANHLLRFWPVPVILIGVLMVVQARDGRERTRGLVFAGVGTWFFLYSEGLVTVRIWELIWPVILMLVGFSLLFRTGGPRLRRQRRYGRDGAFGPGGPFGPSAPLGPGGPLGPNGPFARGSGGAANASGSNMPFGAGEAFVPSASISSSVPPSMPPPYTDRSERLSMFAFWSSVRRASAASPFRGGDITAIMGGGQLDLRLATIPPGEEAILDIVAVMGGVEILVPSNWEVSTPIFPFMGGVEDKRFPPLLTDPNAVRKDSGRLVLRGLVMMGGVHIKS
jgi:predicted membrane protein